MPRASAAQVPIVSAPGRPADASGALRLHACDPSAWLTAEEALLYCGGRRSEHSAAEQDGVARHHPARCGPAPRECAARRGTV